MSRKPRAFKICGGHVASCHYDKHYGAQISVGYWGLNLRRARRLYAWLGPAIKWMEEKERTDD